MVLATYGLVELVNSQRPRVLLMTTVICARFELEVGSLDRMNFRAQRLDELTGVRSQKRAVLAPGVGLCPYKRITQRRTGTRAEMRRS